MRLFSTLIVLHVAPYNRRWFMLLYCFVVTSAHRFNRNSSATQSSKAWSLYSAQLQQFSITVEMAETKTIERVCGIENTCEWSRDWQTDREGGLWEKWSSDDGYRQRWMRGTTAKCTLAGLLSISSLDTDKWNLKNSLRKFELAERKWNFRPNKMECENEKHRVVMSMAQSDAESVSLDRLDRKMGILIETDLLLFSWNNTCGLARMKIHWIFFGQPFTNM